MKKILILALLISLSACGNTKDLARTLKYADSGRSVGIDSINFKELKQMKRGQTCTWNFLFIFPIFGDGSILTAAEKGDINNVQLIGETGYWYGGIISKSCTVVYGDNNKTNPTSAAPAAKKTSR